MDEGSVEQSDAHAGPEAPTHLAPSGNETEGVSAPATGPEAGVDDSVGGGDAPATANPAQTKAAAQRAAASAKRVKSLVEWVVVIAVALIVALGIRQFVFQPFWIPSGSMEDTLDIGDRVLVNKASYRFHGIRRGDVVVFKQPATWPLGESVKDLIKRVIALPGDEVFIHDCSVWLNGAKLIEPYTDGKCTEPAEAILDADGDGKFVVPQKMIFVMGDNRTGSTDSRFNGFVPKKDVVGRAFVIIWPKGHWGWL